MMGLGAESRSLSGATGLSLVSRNMVFAAVDQLASIRCLAAIGRWPPAKGSHLPPESLGTLLGCLVGFLNPRVHSELQMEAAWTATNLAGSEHGGKHGAVGNGRRRCCQCAAKCLRRCLLASDARRRSHTSIMWWFQDKRSMSFGHPEHSPSWCASGVATALTSSLRTAPDKVFNWPLT